MTYIQIENLSKRLGGEQAVDDLSLSLGRGEFMVIFGPSGCGKTSLLRLIAGVHSADEGTLRIGGETVNDLEPEHRGVAMAFQSFALYPHFSAYENIASPLRAGRVGEAEIRRRVEEVAGMLRIAHVLDHKPGELSNGQKQRTSLARSLIARPRVLLLDDPLRNVDAKLRYEMRIELPEVLRRFETTVIYVTQDFKEAMALGDRVAVMIDGAIRQVGTPASIYREPSDTRVAQLFGDPPINLVRVRPRRDDDGDIRVDLGGHPLVAPTCPDGFLGRECVLGIRPEDVHFLDVAQPEAIPVTLEAVMPLNVRTALLVRTPEALELTASAWDIREDLSRASAASVHVDLGQAVYFECDQGTHCAS